MRVHKMPSRKVKANAMNQNPRRETKFCAEYVRIRAEGAYRYSPPNLEMLLLRARTCDHNLLLRAKPQTLVEGSQGETE